MSVIVVDTSSWVSYFRQTIPSIIDEALTEGRVLVPCIVVAELFSAHLSQRQRRELESFLSDLPLCSADFSHWVRVGKLRSLLRMHGLAISTPDAHVAQCALDHQADLLTEDRIFSKIAETVNLQLAEG